MPLESVRDSPFTFLWLLTPTLPRRPPSAPPDLSNPKTVLCCVCCGRVLKSLLQPCPVLFSVSPAVC